MNVTAVNALTAGFLTVFPCSGAVPNTSTVNYVANEARPNNTIVGLSGGRICVFSDAATDVLVDLVGSFGPTGLGYQPTPPIRVLDTRASGALGPGGAVVYSVAAGALGGRTPGAAYVNVTAANHLVAGQALAVGGVDAGAVDAHQQHAQVGQAFDGVGCVGGQVGVPLRHGCLKTGAHQYTRWQVVHGMRQVLPGYQGPGVDGVDDTAATQVRVQVDVTDRGTGVVVMQRGVGMRPGVGRQREGTDIDGAARADARGPHAAEDRVTRENRRAGVHGW